jgi:hypothetical protein
VLLGPIAGSEVDALGVADGFSISEGDGCEPVGPAVGSDVVRVGPFESIGSVVASSDEQATNPNEQVRATPMRNE